jgi:hypothetical protein
VPEQHASFVVILLRSGVEIGRTIVKANGENEAELMAAEGLRQHHDIGLLDEAITIRVEKI